MKKKLENVTESNQKWQKTDKNDRKTGKMLCFPNYPLPRFSFCPAKLPYLSCQGSISVLPSTHFCPAKLTNFSRGGAKAPPAPPKYAYDNNGICVLVVKMTCPDGVEQSAIAGVE